MSEPQRPLILFTNDDGIDSPGLWAAVQAFADAGDLLVVAPREQQSGASRSMPGTSRGRLFPYEHPVDLPGLTAFAVDGTPAQAVQFAVLELADRSPALVVSGINYGENTGNVATLSGTVGAAIEAASLGLRAIAVSQHLNDTDPAAIDFRAAAFFARCFGGLLLQSETLPADLDFLKLDVPFQATPDSQWRLTRLSRLRVYWPTRPERTHYTNEARLRYAQQHHPSSAEPDSDVYAVQHEGIVAVTPMSLDMTSRTDLEQLRRFFAARHYRPDDVQAAE